MIASHLTHRTRRIEIREIEAPGLPVAERRLQCPPILRKSFISTQWVVEANHRKASPQALWSQACQRYYAKQKSCDAKSAHHEGSKSEGPAVGRLGRLASSNLCQSEAMDGILAFNRGSAVTDDQRDQQNDFKCAAGKTRPHWLPPAGCCC